MAGPLGSCQSLVHSGRVEFKTPGLAPLADLQSVLNDPEFQLLQVGSSGGCDVGLLSSLG